MRDDLISRQAAIDKVCKYCEYYYNDNVIQSIKEIPSAQPTLYGYDLKHLAFIASIMAKEGVSPNEAVAIFRDVDRVIEMALKEMKEVHENALIQVLKKWEGKEE